MRALVTGVAGFVGSHLAEGLLARGWQVRGVDAFTSTYAPSRKRRNLVEVARTGEVELVTADLCQAELEPIVDGCDAVFHLAGVPGVRVSWADGFAEHLRGNTLGTQRLLEALRDRPGARLVLASSSSVYGPPAGPTSRETDLPRPHSPYGVSKLAAEQLCAAYHEAFGIDHVVLRYFSVYGPRQRPDMAIHRLIDAARSGQPFPVYGTGEQVRDLTYVEDVVAATIRAADRSVPTGTVVNVAGGGGVSVLELIELVGELIGSPVPVVHLPAQAGEVLRTGGDIARATRVLGWRPVARTEDGVARQLAWHLDGRNERAGAPA